MNRNIMNRNIYNKRKEWLYDGKEKRIERIHR